MTRKKGIPKMTTLLRSVASRPVWKALEAHHEEMRELHLRKLFADDPKRDERFDKPPYIQAFDHRGSFQTKIFGWLGKLAREQTAEVAAAAAKAKTNLSNSLDRETPSDGMRRQFFSETIRSFICALA
jgi:hypothetical protein